MKYYLNVKYAKDNQIIQTGRTDGYTSVDELIKDAKFYVLQEKKHPSEYKVIFTQATPVDTIIESSIKNQIINEQ